MTPAERLARLLRLHRRRMARVVPFDLTAGGLTVFDFSAANHDLLGLDLNDAAGFTEYLFERIVRRAMPVGIGRYDEDRVLYRHSPLFDGDSERRSVHLGIDLFVVEETQVSTPLEASLHSWADNAGLGDYGPTVVLAHELDGTPFFTLYGHLSRESLYPLEPGRTFAAGEPVGWVGDIGENGGWPPHLHFQVIADMLGFEGDYPGVAAPSQRARFLGLCPDPNLILQIPGL